MQPTDELTDDCVNLLKSNGSAATKVSEVIASQDSVVRKLLNDG